LAGGSGTRLYPLTRSVSKQLLPVYDKPMIYYPLSVLMLSQIQEILIISTPHDLPHFEKLFGDGASIGLKISYAAQPKPEGLAQAFIIAEEFLDGAPSCLILGDNLFYGHDFANTLRSASVSDAGGTIFGYPVSDPTIYGVVEWGSDGKVLSLEEKPREPKSQYAIPGLYFFDGRASEFAKKQKPSTRGELEILDLAKCYLNENSLHVSLLGRGLAWLDTGNPESLLQAGQFVQAIQERQGMKIACIEEIAFAQKWIDAGQLEKLASALGKTEYAAYLMQLIKRSSR